MKIRAGGERSENGRSLESGKRFASARSALGMTQAALAQRLGASLATVKGYEGGRRLPSGAMAEGLARLGVNLTYVLKGEGPVLLEGEARRDQADMYLTEQGAPGPAGKVYAVQVKSTSVHAKWWVDETARQLEWSVKPLIRQALILAVKSGLETDTLHAVMVLLKAQEEADKRALEPSGGLPPSVP